MGAILTPSYNPSLGLAWRGMWNVNFVAAPVEDVDAEDEASTDAQ